MFVDLEPETPACYSVPSGPAIGGIFDPAITAWKGNRYSYCRKTLKCLEVEEHNLVWASWADRADHKEPEQQLVISSWMEMEDYLKFRGQ